MLDEFEVGLKNDTEIFLSIIRIKLTTNNRNKLIKPQMFRV